MQGVAGVALTTLSSYAARTMSKAAFLYLSSVSSTGWYMAPRTFLPNRSLSMLSTFTCSEQAINVRYKQDPCYLPAASMTSLASKLAHCKAQVRCPGMEHP